MKKWVLTVRSKASMTLPTIRGGIANTIMNMVTSMAHTNKGIRLSDMPSARCLNTVTISSTAATSAEISMNVIIVAQKSRPSPGEYWVSVSGT